MGKSPRPEPLAAYSKELQHLYAVLPFDADCAKHTAQVRVQLEPTEMTIGPDDLQIAGTSLAHNLTLVTHHLRDFSRVPDLRVVDRFGG